MALWQRRPKMISVKTIDLNKHPPGIVIAVRMGQLVYWLTPTYGFELIERAYGTPYVNGVAVHANSSGAPYVSPRFISTRQVLNVGEQLRIGVRGDLKPVSDVAVSEIRTYSTSGVKIPKIPALSVPPNGADLSAEPSGTAIEAQLYDGNRVFLTSAHPTTVTADMQRGVFVMCEDNPPLVTPYYCAASRLIAPGQWLRVLLGEDDQATPIINAPIISVAVNGVART